MEEEEKARIEAIAAKVAKALEEEKRQEQTPSDEQLRQRNALLEQQLQKSSLLHQQLQQALSVERYRLRSMSLWWVGLCFVTLILTLGHWDRGSIPRTAMSFLSFLLVWRGLYMNNNGNHVVLAVIISLLSLLLM